MREKFPHEHDVFASALGEIREHFENAAGYSRDYAFVYGSIVDEFRRAEDHVTRFGVDEAKPAIDMARRTLISIYEEPDFGMLSHDINAAADIAQRHKRAKLGL